MSTAPIALQALTVDYGAKRALEDVSLQLEEGSVLALLGRNGAGKSTLIHCALGLIRPTDGRALLFGEDAWERRASAMERIGVVFENDIAPPALSASELARFCSRCARTWDQGAFDARMRRLGVGTGVPFGRLSKGQKREVALGLALASSPELLVLDDPTLGLDPVARQELYGELVAELADRGTTVVIATHDIAAVDRLATHVAILKGGAVTLLGQVDELRDRFRRLRWSSDAGPLGQVLGELGCVHTKLRLGAIEAVVSRFERDTFEPYRRSVRAEIDVAEMSLEQIFTAVSNGTEEVHP